MPDTMPQTIEPTVELIDVCPFCGGRTEMTQEWYPVSGIMYYTLCFTCWARGPMSQRREDAVMFWNTAKRLID